jgi:hypothetical protein
MARREQLDVQGEVGRHYFKHLRTSPPEKIKEDKPSEGATD